MRLRRWCWRHCPRGGRRALETLLACRGLCVPACRKGAPGLSLLTLLSLPASLTCCLAQEEDVLMARIKGCHGVEADPGQGGGWKGSSSSRRSCAHFLRQRIPDGIVQ